MRKNRVLIIRFENWENFKKKASAALKAKKLSRTSNTTLVFASVADYQKFMTEQKLAILAAIISKKPSSIYQLSQLVDRDFANVQRDCVALVGMGFIKLIEAEDHRKSKSPRLAFDYTKIVIQMPRVSYSHNLEEAA
jgi:predicted transcriptional regulator